MAHHLGVRHKNSDSNGAPSSGAPLVTFYSLFFVASNNFLENDDQIWKHLWMWKNIIKFVIWKYLWIWKNIIKFVIWKYHQFFWIFSCIHLWIGKTFMNMKKYHQIWKNIHEFKKCPWNLKIFMSSKNINKFNTFCELEIQYQNKPK